MAIDGGFHQRRPVAAVADVGIDTIIAEQALDRGEVAAFGNAEQLLSLLVRAWRIAAASKQKGEKPEAKIDWTHHRSPERLDGSNALIIRQTAPGSHDNPQTRRNLSGSAEVLDMQLVGILIAFSLLLLAGLGIAALFMAGRNSRSANEDDPDGQR
jgi:hypothetical protein